MSDGGLVNYGGPPPTIAPPPHLAAPTVPPWQVPPPFAAPIGPRPEPRRPGAVTTAAVLGYVVSGMLLLAAVLLFLGAAVVSDVADLDGTARSGLSAELVLDGTLNVIVAALLIASSVALAGGSATGRLGYLVAGTIVVVESIYWIARWTSSTGGGLLVYALLFVALMIIGMGCALGPGSVTWLDSRH